MARRKKGFDYAEGVFYFQIKSHPNNITISRREERNARNMYEHYKSVGKNIEWLGKWNGKKFES